MRKILKNSRKSNRASGNPKGKIGLELPILDRDGNAICVGDYLRYGPYEGRILYNYDSCLPRDGYYALMIRSSMTPGADEYDVNSYYQCIGIPMDNGARMEIEKIR